MASLTVEISAVKILQSVHATMNDLMVVRLAELLGLSKDEASDWIIGKVAAFRGMSESDIAQMLYATDQEV